MNRLKRREQWPTRYFADHPVMLNRIKRFASYSMAGAMLIGADLSGNEAHAQSSVQLYGIVDNALTYTNNIRGGHTWAQFSGVARNDRWGFRGVEDLGGGYQAIFRLENGFSSTNGTLGQGGLEFGRQAFVGLASDRMGTISLGRQYDFMTTNLSAFSAGTLIPSVFAFHLGDYDRLGGERIDNTVKYVSPNLAGLQFGALYAFGGQAGNFERNSALGFGAAYALGSLRLAAAYTAIHNYQAVFGIGTPVLGAPLSGSGPLGTLSKPVIFDKLIVSGLAAGYQFGTVLVQGLFTLVDFQNKGRSNVLRTEEGNVQYKLSPAFFLAASYAFSKLDRDHWNQIALGADYFLSSRTDVYLNAVYLRASSGVTAEMFLLSPSSTNTQTIVSLGLRHTF
ncbi:porin [Paraburkholderia lacunae]|uniref:Porin n=1 Tax=Paraburkholderia lacunae TaxID=2211104 RepID=A0A370N5W0_9BURK|nr:porin [Paraburkholderia lacunae]RDK01003.1 porin [Paraburkholderia lacunae]